MIVAGRAEFINRHPEGETAPQQLTATRTLGGRIEETRSGELFVVHRVSLARRGRSFTPTMTRSVQPCRSEATGQARTGCHE